MKKLIINADDLGFSRVVNDSILEGVKKGVVTAASLMVNMPFAEEIVQKIAEEMPELSIGLHFTLTSGISLAAPGEIPFLVDEKGWFQNGFFGLFRLLRSGKREAVLEQVRREWERQLAEMDRLVAKYRLRFDHMDSHQHVHVLPGLFEMLATEARKRDVVLRVPREPFGSWDRFVRRLPVWGPVGLLKRTVLNVFLRSVPQQIGYFGILDTGKMDANAMFSIVSTLSRDKSWLDCYELNTHPAQSPLVSKAEDCRCSDDDFRFYCLPQRQVEYQTLLCEEVRECLEKHDIQLAGF